MKVLVTGCNGQVGSHLVKLLTGKVKLLAVDRRQLDITNQDSVTAMVAQFDPDYIINAAAYTAVDRAEEEIEASYAINFKGPQYLAEAAEKCGAVILHISTDYVFDGGSSTPYFEGDSTNPKGVYGQSKLAGEKAVAKACTKYFILRTAWVFGEDGNNFVKTMLRLAQSRNELSIVDDQVGGPTYAKDIASALVKMIETVEDGKSSAWGIYHFSGMPHVSWFEFAEAIFFAADGRNVLAELPKVSAIPTSAYPTPALRPANSRMDCNKINQMFDVKPSDWQHALENIQNYK